MRTDDQEPEPRSQNIRELKQRWQSLFGSPSPQGLGRELLARGISWKEQERIHGGLTSSTRRELARLMQQLERSGDLDLERQMSLKAGTRLVREWNGRTCHVTILDKGFLFEERLYASLSQIARAVTGTRWSGPRFFGLSQRSRSGAGDG